MSNDLSCYFFSSDSEDSNNSQHSDKSNKQKLEFYQLKQSESQMNCEDDQNYQNTQNEHRLSNPRQYESSSQKMLSSIDQSIDIRDQQDLNLSSDDDNNQNMKQFFKISGQRFKRFKNKKNAQYLFPGETKNVYNNFGQGLKHFIKLNFDLQIQGQQEIKQFLETKKFSSAEFKRSIRQTIQMRRIARQFFGQFSWAPFFLSNNRVDLEQYFRLYLL